MHTEAAIVVLFAKCVWFVSKGGLYLSRFCLAYLIPGTLFASATMETVIAQLRLLATLTIIYMFVIQLLPPWCWMHCDPRSS